MTDPETLVVTVTGPTDQLAAFAQWCLAVEYLGSVGASRTVETAVDGDGSAALRFDFGETDVSELPTPTEAELDDGTIRTPGIGE